MIENKREEYYFLTDKLQEIYAALEGNCKVAVPVGWKKEGKYAKTISME